MSVIFPEKYFTYVINIFRMDKDKLIPVIMANNVMQIWVCKERLVEFYCVISR